MRVLANFGRYDQTQLGSTFFYAGLIWLTAVFIILPIPYFMIEKYVVLAHIITTATPPHQTYAETNDLQRNDIPVQNQHDPLNTEYNNPE